MLAKRYYFKEIILFKLKTDDYTWFPIKRAMAFIENT